MTYSTYRSSNWIVVEAGYIHCTHELSPRYRAEVKLVYVSCRGLRRTYLGPNTSWALHILCSARSFGRDVRLSLTHCDLWREAVRRLIGDVNNLVG